MIASLNKVALESYTFWLPLCRLSDVHPWALLGNEQGETSFLPNQVGDHGEAHGIFQWHLARVEAIKSSFGVDVRTAPHLDQLKAAHWEMNHADGYKRVWAKLMATDSVEDAVLVLVADFEKSSSQARDVARRVGYAKSLKAQFERSTDLSS